jgi:phosphate transport system substrate-binding protein
MTARGNEGVASRINVSEGAIGYVEYGFAKRLGLPMARLENRMGQFVEPNGRTGQNALLEGSENMPQNLRFFIPDPDGQDAYPIVTYSWLLLYDDYANSDRKSALKNFLFWGLEAGQKFSEELGYIPLPQEIVSRGQAILDRVHD